MPCESREQPSLMQQVIASGHMFMEVDGDFTVLVVDPALEARFGVRKGSKCYAALGHGSDVCRDCPAKRVFQGERSAELRLTVKDVAGRPTVLHVIGTPQWDVTGDVIGCSLLVVEEAKSEEHEPHKSDGYDFHKLLDNLPDTVFALQEDGRFTYVNRSAQKFLGCRDQEILGKFFWDFVDPAEVALAKRLLETPVGSCWDEQLSILDSRGNKKYCRIRSAPFLDARGAVSGHEGVMRDRTSQRKMELDLHEYQQQLSETTQRFQQLLEEVPDVIFSMDPKGRLTFVNPQARELLGYERKDLVGTLFRDLVSSEDMASVESLLHVEPGTTWDEEITVHHQDGSRRWVRIRCRPVCDPEGHIVEFEGVLRDRTDRKKLEDDLKASKGQLLEKIGIIDELYEHIVQSEKSRAIAEHTAEVAHELRQPLAVIGGFARRMYRQIQTCKHADPKEQEECFAIIVKEVERLEDILKGLIDFTRQKTLTKRRVDPNSLIQLVLDIYKVRLQEKSLRLEVDFGEIGEVLLDPDRFQQVVRNLVSNAIEASRYSGMIRIETAVFVVSDKAQVTGELDSEAYFEFKIRNGGRRIHEDELRKIFDPFYTTKERGAGIGLSLVKRIIEEHGGSISVKSDEKGTVFTTWIPIDHSVNGESQLQSGLVN